MSVHDVVPLGLDAIAFVNTPWNPSAASFFIYGSYPVGERWRVDIFFAVLAFCGGVLGVFWSGGCFVTPAAINDRLIDLARDGALVYVHCSSS